MSSRSLHYSEADCHRYLEQAKQLRRINGVFCLAPLAKLVASLTGSGLSIDSYLDNKSSKLLTDHLDLANTAADAYLGNYQEAADLAIRRGSTYDRVYPAMPIGMLDKFLIGVCLYDAAIRTGRRKYRNRANAIRATIHSWVNRGNPNVNHYACLLDAEFFRMKNQTSMASKFYENAVIIAGRAGLLQDAALAQERYALCILNSKGGSREEARFHIRKAMELYGEWGADAKTKSIEVNYRDLLSEDTQKQY